MLASGVAELVTLGTVLPFIALLSDPQRLWKYQVVQELSIRFGFSSANQLLLPVTLLFASAAILAACIRIANLWFNGRLAAAAGSDLSCEYRRTLFQPYVVHGAVIFNCNYCNWYSDCPHRGRNILLRVITSAVVVVFDDRTVGDRCSCCVDCCNSFGIAYGVLAITARDKLRTNGHRIAEASNQQLKALQEGLGAIRDVLLDNSQSTYLQIYQQADRPQRQLQAKNNFLAAFPRYTLESIGLVGIALLGGTLVLQRGSGAAVIPLLGSLALGAQRLLPALQQIYKGWSALTGYSAAMQSVLASQPAASFATACS